MRSALAHLQRESLLLPRKLQAMIARYIEAANEGRDAPSLFRHGAHLLNRTFRLAADGDDEAVAALERDRLSAVHIAIAAELFSTAALTMADTPSFRSCGRGG